MALIPVELFQILIDDAVKVRYSIWQEIWKSQLWLSWKWASFHSNLKKGNANECSNYHAIAVISHANKEMLKILQARLQEYVNHELPDIQACFRKYRGTKDQIPNICWIFKKEQVISRKTSSSALLSMSKPLTIWIKINCGKFWKRWQYRTTGLASWEACMQFRKQQLELDIE